MELIAGPFTLELCEDFVCCFYTEDRDEGCFDINLEDIPDFIAALNAFVNED